MQPVTDQYCWPSNMHSLLKYIRNTDMASLETKKFITDANVYWFVLAQLCSNHHVTLQSSVRYVSSTFVRIQHTVCSAKLIGCYSTNGIMEVKTSHFKNVLIVKQVILVPCIQASSDPLQQHTSTSCYRWAALTSFLSFEWEVSPSSGPTGCSSWQWHTCSAKRYENNAPTCQQMK